MALASLRGVQRPAQYLESRWGMHMLSGEVGTKGGVHCSRVSLGPLFRASRVASVRVTKR